MRTRILAGLGLALAMAAVTFVRGDGGGDLSEYAFARGDDLAELERGEWRIVELDAGGKEFSKVQLEQREMRMVFKDGKLRSQTGKGKSGAEMPLRLNAGTTPRQIEWQTKAGKNNLGIYQLDGDTLRIAVGLTDRPTDFTPGANKIVYVLKRVRP
jgi:uncharacterized protein (TIGR03067 family)